MDILYVHRMESNGRQYVTAQSTWVYPQGTCNIEDFWTIEIPSEKRRCEHNLRIEILRAAGPASTLPRRRTSAAARSGAGAVREAKKIRSQRIEGTHPSPDCLVGRDQPQIFLIHLAM